MSTPLPTDPAFAVEYGRAWSTDPDRLLEYFTPDAVYVDVAMDGTYEGHEEISRFHRFMLKFAPDSHIEFGPVAAGGGRLHTEWVWSGTFSGPLRLRTGAFVDATGTAFSVPGVAACTYSPDGRLTAHRDYWDLTTVLHQASVPIG